LPQIRRNWLIRAPHLTGTPLELPCSAGRFQKRPDIDVEVT